MAITSNAIFCGIDNGVSGSIGVITIDGAVKKTAFIETPVIKCRSYTQKKQYIHRIDFMELILGFNAIKEDVVHALLERPMVNSRAFTSTASALRALEATIIALEYCHIPYSYIDSKEWQKEFIASSIIGHKDMKYASMRIGCDLFPNNESFIKKHKDADGLLIAEYCYRKYAKQ